ncbi:MAG: ferredoxin--nitrite reductase [Bacillus sp. (in: firmicutes)]|nr:ferredoxin--nitrite reductase [Bacillus sp. (in: firmicutes)]
MPDIYNRLEKVGLYSFEACGDCPSTIVGNPLAGIDKDELIDTRGIVKKVNAFFVLNRDFSNLPQKYKVSISGNTYNNARFLIIEQKLNIQHNVILVVTHTYTPI